jgi:hypothetical protein
MALPTLIATVGATNANSFGTRAEADAYFETVLHADTPWPSNVAASVTLGSGTNGVVTVTADTEGTEGNDLTIVAVLGSGNNIPLFATIVGDVITVTLGTDGAGANDATKNTATLVAAVIAALTGVTATASGTGASRVPVTATRSFTGGTYNEELKLPALIMAAQQLTALVQWTGYYATTTQRLPWPRTGMYQRNDWVSVLDSVIPEEVKHAQFELARLLITEDRTAESEIDTNALTHLRAGPITMKFRDYGSIGSGVLTSVVWDLLVPSWYTEISGMVSSNRDLLRG